jgi:hypothetical protein
MRIDVQAVHGGAMSFGSTRQTSIAVVVTTAYDNWDSTSTDDALDDGADQPICRGCRRSQSFDIPVVDALGGDYGTEYRDLLCREEPVVLEVAKVRKERLKGLVSAAAAMVGAYAEIFLNAYNYKPLIEGFGSFEGSFVNDLKSFA